MTQRSPFSNPGAIAEDKILELFRNEGVFAPPHTDDINQAKANWIVGMQQTQTFDVARAIHALCKFYMNTGMHPRRLRDILLDELIIWNKY